MHLWAAATAVLRADMRVGPICGETLFIVEGSSLVYIVVQLGYIETYLYNPACNGVSPRLAVERARRFALCPGLEALFCIPA